MRRLLLCLLVAGVGDLRLRARRGGVPAVPVQLRDQQVQPVPLRARGRRPAVVVGAQRERRHDQHGRRRRLPARRGHAAVVARAGARPAPRGRRAPTTAASESPHTRVVPDAGGRSTRASRSPTRSRCTSRAACAARCGRVGIHDTGAARLHDLSTVGDRFISREHYLMWRPSATGPYARLGRFYAPYGLRFVEHIYFVRRYTGYELYNETYNVSGGYVADDWELHAVGVHAAAVRLPRPAAVGRRARVGRRRVLREAHRRHGGAGARRRASASARRRAATRAAWSASCGSSRPSCCSWARPTSSIQQVSAASYGQNQFVSYLGVTVLPVRGVMLGGRVRALPGEPVGRGDRPQRLHSGRSTSSRGPTARWCCCSATRWSGMRRQPAATLGMLQLHYYL